jgi:hypothetical protein
LVVTGVAAKFAQIIVAIISSLKHILIERKKPNILRRVWRRHPRC